MRSESRAVLVRCWVTLVQAMLLVGCGSGSEDADNEPPSAEAGADQRVFDGTTVTLRGTGSDADGSIARYTCGRRSVALRLLCLLRIKPSLPFPPQS